ncbi:hypothetical protein EVAR_92059_1 [Eumeta japonica]|uniref:Uncharacterized protein n=1 Tax=Eumeta variegata TaxID=151549 RepID=A0A4C1T1K0_EUMVA|nr:hypothetical protein EVAR_92059_1 [Eumeta japonica]
MKPSTRYICDCGRAVIEWLAPSALIPRRVLLPAHGYSLVIDTARVSRACADETVAAVTDAHIHSQRRRSHQCVAGLLDKKTLSDGEEGADGRERELGKENINVSRPNKRTYRIHSDNGHAPQPGYCDTSSRGLFALQIVDRLTSRRYDFHVGGAVMSPGCGVGRAVTYAYIRFEIIYSRVFTASAE